MGCEILVTNGTRVVEVDLLRQEGQLLRCDFLDAFARLEFAVMQYIESTDVRVSPGQPFSQKLSKLHEARDRFRNPKRLDVRVEAIRQLLPFRADIVHAVLEIVVTYDGTETKQKLRFKNSSDAKRPALLIDRQELVSKIGRLNQLANQFSQQRLKSTPAALAATSATASGR